jgi:hypothetical protein
MSKFLHFSCKVFVLVGFAVILIISPVAQGDTHSTPNFSDGVYKLFLPLPSHDIEDVNYEMGEIHGRLSPSGRFVFASSEPFLFTNEGRFVQLEQFQYVWDLADDLITERVTVVSYDLEMQLTDVVGSRFAFSPDEQRLAFQHADELIIFSVPEFETITTIAIPEIDPSHRLGGTLNRGLQITWSPDSEVVVVITDKVYAISREGQIVGEQALDEWSTIRELGTYIITPTTNTVIFTFNWDELLFSYCNWTLNSCSTYEQTEDVSSLRVISDGEEIIATRGRDRSQFLVWEWIDGEYIQQSEPIQTSGVGKIVFI